LHQRNTKSNTTGTTFNEDASKEDDDSKDSDKGDKGDEGVKKHTFVTRACATPNATSSDEGAAKIASALDNDGATPNANKSDEADSMGGGLLSVPVSTRLHQKNTV
jgi:hypothetical protein